MVRAVVASAALAAALAPLACSSSSAPAAATPDAAIADAGPDVDYGQPSDTYPAFLPPMPQIVPSGGAVLASPRIVPVFFASDALEAPITDFVQKLAAWSAWPTLVGEYGVGAATVAPSIHLTAPAAATYTDLDVEVWVASQLDGTHAEWGTTDAATLATSIYVVFFPPGTTVSLTGTTDATCGNVGAYHDETKVGATRVSFVVMPRCPASTLSVLDQVTLKTTHEITETVTDPAPRTAPAFYEVDEGHRHWSFMAHGGEVGDLCQDFDSSRYKPTDLGYLIQRAWSNAASKAGHDPCAPIPASAGGFFGTAPVDDEPVPILVDGKRVTLRGVNVPIGQTRVIELRLFSDAKTDPWSVEVFDALVARGYPRTLDLSLDGDRGANGNKLHLSITANAKSSFGASIVRIDSLAPSKRSVHYLAVGTSSQ